MFLLKETIDSRYWECVDYLNANYEYCYLDSMHYINMEQETEVIVTGLSYGLNTIDAHRLNAVALNFSMNSQDLYYDFLHAKRVILNGRGKLQKCFITMSYYSLFYDLSLSSNNDKCIKTYMPLFRDSHHAVCTEGNDSIKAGENTLNKLFARSFFLQNPSYYGPAVQREWIPASVGSPSAWQSISAQKKNEFASELAGKHNKHFLHRKTLEENIQIAEQYIALLAQHGIQPIVLITPFTKEYVTYIRKEYKEILLQFLEQLPYQIDFLDMNELNIFEEEDFIDADHLNCHGALKATQAVNDIFL